MDEIRNSKGSLELQIEINETAKSTNLKEASGIRSMTKELNDVDIYDGIHQLMTFTKNGDSLILNDAIKMSGIKYISNIIKKYLEPFSENFFVEYSLISSTLNPKDPDKLQCCAFAIGDETFRDCVDNYYTQCIDKTEEDKSISIYQHPDFLYDIPHKSKVDEYINNLPKEEDNVTKKDPLTNVDISYHTLEGVDDNTKTKVITNGRGLTVSVKQQENPIGSRYEITTPKGGHLKFDESINFSIEAFSLDRHFKEMLLDAKTFIVKKEERTRLVDIQNCLHSYCHRNIACNASRNIDTVRSSLYVSFPIYGSVASNQLPQYRISEKALQGIGACFLYLEPKDLSVLEDPQRFNELKSNLSFIADLIGDAIRFISANYMFNLGLQLQENARKEAIRSAKAAIMARNMSHNLGSHVMSYLKQKLGSITSILNDDKVLFNIFDKGKEPNTITNKIQLPFLVGTGRFIGYLQERQDYIATIATDYIPYGAPVNLKDAIYDELNPDLRHKRHNDKNDNNRPLNVLLSYIAKSEGLSRENMEQEGFATKNDILIGFPKYVKDSSEPHVFGIGTDNCDSDDEALTEMRKINFNLPGGLVGRQAIFSIVENLIRNAAKHGNTRAVDNLEFTFDIINLGNLSNEPCIEDRICSAKWRNLYEKAVDRKNLYLLTITDNLKYDKSIIDKLEPGLSEDYVDAFGKMTAGNKGLKEIRTSASWLRSETDESKYMRYVKVLDKQSDSEREILVEGERLAPTVAIELTKVGHLRYMICLPQDRFAAIVKPDCISNKEVFDLLRADHNNDWDYYDSVTAVKQDIKKTYRYIIVPDKETYEQLRPYTSNRMYIWHPIAENTEEYVNDWGINITPQNDKEKDELYAKRKNLVIRNLYGIDKDSEPIYIWDDTAFKSHKGQAYYKIKLSKGDDYVNIAEYAYRTHHSNESDFNTYWEEKYSTEDDKIDNYKRIKCIDGITGDNSSDRLVRREPLNEEWYCAHLNSFRKKVAIFDERLFKIVHNVEETEFVINAKANAVDNGLASYLGKLTEDKDTNQIKKDILDLKFLSTQDKVKMFGINIRSELIEFLESKTKNLQSLQSNNHRSVFYKEKGVDVFTIIKEKEGRYAIVGCTNVSSEDGKPICVYEKFATITSQLNTSSFSVNINIENDLFKNCYDYISIHQGLLDKLYEGFNIKHPTEILASLDKDKNVYDIIDSCKEIVTTELFNSFIRVENKRDENGSIMLNEYGKPLQFFAHPPISVYEKDESGDIINEYDYLPNFIIHSGRAKPSRVDMPQKQPFVQYSAIEHSVLDCKYALIELLDYAKYEEQN